MKGVAPKARIAPAVLLAALAALVSLTVAACSLGQGQGQVSGVLDVPDCWSGDFNLHPDFFAAVPASTAPNGVATPTNALEIRIQNGSDYENFSDGLIIDVDDAGEVRSGFLNVPLVVSLPADVLPPGVPITPIPNPPIVHAVLYLDRTCRTQNDALYALAAVSTNPDGSCDRPDGGDPPMACGGPATGPVEGGESDAGNDATMDAGSDGATAPDAGPTAAPTVRQSTIAFTYLFDGNPNESNAAARLTSASFEFYLADPREICPGGLGPPPRCRGHLTGWFNFYFQRGRPAQPFP